MREDTGCSLQRVGTRARYGSMRGASRELDLEMQAAVVGGDNAVGEACRDDEIRPCDVLLDEKGGADQAARLLVEGEVQLDRACQRQATLLHGQQRIAVGGEVRLGNGHAASVHHAVDDFRAVGRMRPAFAWRHNIAMRIERDRRSRSEAVAHDEIGGAEHAVGGDAVLGDPMSLDLEADTLQQVCGSVGDGLAVAWWIVRGYADERGEELRLLRTPLAQERTNALPAPIHRYRFSAGRAHGLPPTFSAPQLQVGARLTPNPVGEEATRDEEVGRGSEPAGKFN